MSIDKVCIIGAGSSGIVAAKILHEQGIPYDCFEKGSGIGGNWRYLNDNGMSSAYQSLMINTSKQRMAYSDFPMPTDYPDFAHHSQILAYFENYVDHFGLRNTITFRTGVKQVCPAGRGRWEVTLDNGEIRAYRAVIVASGHHWHPRWPDFPGEFHGLIMHAHDYKVPDPFKDQRVLVVGIGNSGVDLACEMGRNAAKTFLSTRRSAHIIPKYALGRPLDHYTSSAFSRLPLRLQQLLYYYLLYWVRGDQRRYGVPLPPNPILAEHPTVSQDLLHKVKAGLVTMKPNIDRLMGNRVRFTDGSEEQLDAIIYATGYKINFPFLSPEVYQVQANVMNLYLHVVPPELPGLYFLGFIQPLGAIMPLAELQAQWIAGLLKGTLVLPDKDTLWRDIDRTQIAMRKRYITSRRHTIEVDFFPYKERLEREMHRAKHM
ncbi:MAG: NAD(P)-binding domain-containing protein [Chloroflexi bacterium]|nr:NAD(P)-binding domain-containing protein [Chloroflexota bacterium]MBP8055231.1 NAD(P)-binding domain-containing protein [Chloroflexota bacterium]